MKTIRFSLILYGKGEAIASIRWYQGTILRHYSTTNIHLDTLPPGTYSLSFAAQLLAGTQMMLLVDDITDIDDPHNLLREFYDHVTPSGSRFYTVKESYEAAS